MNFTIIVVALLPVAILVFYIYYKDRRSPEPAWQLVRAFLYGVLSTFFSLNISIPLEMLGVYPEEATSALGGISRAFFAAAIPEETAKLFMLWLVLRKNPYFDEKMDGIVYAVCVSLGFAAFENILYLTSNAENYLAVGFSRAIFSVPAHFSFGVLMGYYYSLAKFYPKSLNKNRILVLLAPIMAHGIYDSILMVMGVTPNPVVASLLMIVFLVFCHKMWKYGSKRIEEHLKSDGICMRE